MQQAASGSSISVVTPSDSSISVVTPSGTAAGDDEAQATAESAGAAEQCGHHQGLCENLQPWLKPAADDDSTADDSNDSDWHSSSEEDDEADGSEQSAEPGSRKRGRLQQASGNGKRVAWRRSAATDDAAARPAGAAGGRRQSRGCQMIVIEELPGGIIQSSVDVSVPDTGEGWAIHLPKAFAMRCFPRLPCEVLLQLEMAPAAAGAGVASERPAGAPAEGTARLTARTRSSGGRFTYMSAAVAGLASYRGFKIIAWQAPKPDSDGSNSSRLTVLLQSPAAQQAVAAAASAAAAEAAAEADSAAAAGGDGSGLTWHVCVPAGYRKNVAWSRLNCPRKLVAAAFLPHHPAGTRSLQLQLSVFKDGQPVAAATGNNGTVASSSGDSSTVRLRFCSRWRLRLPAPLRRLVSGCELQLMRAAAPNLLQVFVASASSRQPAASEGAVAVAAGDKSAATAALLGRTPGSASESAPAEQNTPPAAAAQAQNTSSSRQQPPPGSQLLQCQPQQQAMAPGPSPSPSSVTLMPAPAAMQNGSSRAAASGTVQHASNRCHQWQQRQPDAAGLPGPGCGLGRSTKAAAGGWATAGHSRLMLPVKPEAAVRPPAAMASAAASDTTAAGHTSSMIAAATATQPAGSHPANLAQLPAGYALPPVDSAAAGMQQLLGLLQLLQADKALLAKFTAKLGRLQQAPVGDRQLHWFAVSYEMARTWLQRRDFGMVLQSLEVALM